MNLSVINEKVLVEALPIKEETGIISAEEENIIKGKIISLGDSDSIFNLEQNMTIWFNKFDAVKLPFNEGQNDLYVLDQKEIVVIENGI